MSNPGNLPSPNADQLVGMEPAQPTIQIVDISEGVRDAAHEYADKFINEKTSDSGVKGWMKKVWYGNVARDYYHLREKRNARDRILEAQNLYAMEVDGDDLSWHQRTTAAVTRRFAHQYDLLHRQAGEDKSELDADTEHGIQIKSAITQLVTRFATGEINEEIFGEERTRILQQLSTGNEGMMKEGVLYADNLLEVAQNVKSAVDAGQDVGEQVDDIKIEVGNAKTGARTNVAYSSTEKIVDKLQQTTIGSLVNETTLATAVSAAYVASEWSFRGATRATLGFAGMGVGAGAIGAIREGKRFKDDRRTHSREKAYGREKADDQQVVDRESTRRSQEMEEFRYETIPASQQTESIVALLADVQARPSLRQSRLGMLRSLVAETQARIELSDSMGVDLIEYSTKSEVENERFELDIMLAEAQVALQDEDGNLGDSFRNQLETAKQSIIDKMEEIDKEFTTARRVNMGRAAIKSAGMGMALGLIFQEVGAHVSDSQVGLFEDASLEGDSDSELVNESLLRGIFDSQGYSYNEFDLSGDLHEFSINDDVAVKLPAEFELVANDTDGFNLVYGETDELLAENLNFNDDGSLSEESKELLAEQGIDFDEEVQTHTFTEEISEEEARVINQTVDGSEFVEHYEDEFTKVQRELWYDNNTAKPVFDLNELGLHWGEAGSGVDADGNFVFSIATMTEDGSFHGSESAVWQQLAAEGKLKVALSVSEGTQTEVMFVDINPDGTAVVEADSLAAELFSVDEDGRAVFNGRYAEVAELADTEGDTQNIRLLATHIGESADNFEITDQVMDEVTRTVEKTYDTIDTTLIIPDNEVAVDSQVNVPPVIPLFARAGLEKVTTPDAPHSPYSNYETGYARQRAEQWRARRSPRLLEDPSVDLDAAEEIDWYMSQQTSEQRAKITTAIEANREAIERGGPTDLIVSIPVAAAHEADNIYNTLSNYAEQDPSAIDSTVVVLYVNHIEGADQAEIDRTNSEIQRAMSDFPQVRIALFRDEFSQEFVDSKDGHIYGTVIKDLYDVALGVASETISLDGDGSDPLIITNDADARQISNNYLNNLIRSHQRTPQSDIHLGHIHWGTEHFDDMPGYAFVSSFFMQLEHLIRTSDTHVQPASWGPNSGFTASALAAIGGVNDQTGAGADSELGRMILAARSHSDAAGITLGGYASGALDASDLDFGSRKVWQFAQGAWVDSSAERLLGAYRAGTPLTSAWNTFSDGGYQPRTAQLSTSETEDTINNLPDITQRIESQLSGMLSSNWGIVEDNGIIIDALDVLLSGTAVDGKKQYSIVGVGNHKEFRFTPAGFNALGERLPELGQMVRDGLEMLDDMSAKRSAKDKQRASALVTPITDYRRNLEEVRNQANAEAKRIYGASLDTFDERLQFVTAALEQYKTTNPPPARYSSFEAVKDEYISLLGSRRQAAPTA